MIKTPLGDYYTPKEVLALILNAKDYPVGYRYVLLQPVYGGFFVSKEQKDV